VTHCATRTRSVRDVLCDGRAMLTYVDECGGCATMRTWYGRDVDGAT
jgi:hypothetical protein